MAQETQDADNKLWPPYIEQIFMDIMVDEQQKGNMEHGIFKAKNWLSIVKALYEQSRKTFLPKQEDSKAVALWKKGCPNYDKLKQLFAPNTTTDSLQISSNTPAPNSDEEYVLEEELANEAREACRTQLDDNDCYNPNMEGITQDDPTVDEQTQRTEKRPMEEPTTKGKKVAKKNDRTSEMTWLFKSTLPWQGKGFPTKRESLEYDFDDAYFNSDDDDMDIGGCGDDMDTSFSDDDMDISDCDDDTTISANTDSEYNSEEEEFWFIFPLIGEIVAYFQRHYDKCPQRTSILSGSDYMAEVRDGNPTNCHDMFRMTLDLFYHLVDELKHYGYLKEGKGRVDVQEAVAIFLYIVSHNTRMRPMADRFQNSTETVDRKFRRVLRVVHTYSQHLIKPDPNVVGLLEHLQGNNKYDPWFERSIGTIDGTHISARPSAVRL
ncbi:hypothetical protein SO802_031908 [Lithocarpus litseifolius]|uniref:DUF8040 domain-containing protein n=1 Tax=Lithocarpus litseifolius TaxID=425828 RepID=A0AAW2BP85_9ROSI